MRFTRFAVAAAIAAFAMPAGAQMVKAQDPDSLVKALQGGGYAAKLEVDKVGDPMITSGVAGTTFQIFFYNCTEHKACATVTFHSGYDLKASPGLELINEWNRGKRFGRAYLDKEDDPILEMDVDLDDGGVSPLLFIDNMEFWASILADFEKQIGYRK
ncbi:MAG: YbjN domain-containing protein [Alphaproteobacteria bacterium]|nr:MAG: YbjN domain-containing protein [Alphaproteobacteria bacterium]